MDDLPRLYDSDENWMMPYIPDAQHHQENRPPPLNLTPPSPPSPMLEYASRMGIELDPRYLPEPTAFPVERREPSSMEMSASDPENMSLGHHSSPSQLGAAALPIEHQMPDFHTLAEESRHAYTSTPNPMFQSPAFQQFRDNDPFGVSDPFDRPLRYAPRHQHEYRNPFPFQRNEMTPEEHARHAARTGVPPGGFPGLSLYHQTPPPHQRMIDHENREVSRHQSDWTLGNRQPSRQPAPDSSQSLSWPSSPMRQLNQQARDEPINRGPLALNFEQSPPPVQRRRLALPAPSTANAQPAYPPISLEGSRHRSLSLSPPAYRTTPSSGQPNDSYSTSIDVVDRRSFMKAKTYGSSPIVPSSPAWSQSGMGNSQDSSLPLDTVRLSRTSTGPSWRHPSARPSTAFVSGHISVNSIDCTMRKDSPTSHQGSYTNNTVPTFHSPENTLPSHGTVCRPPTTHDQRRNPWHLLSSEQEGSGSLSHQASSTRGSHLDQTRTDGHLFYRPDRNDDTRSSLRSLPVYRTAVTQDWHPQEPRFLTSSPIPTCRTPTLWQRFLACLGHERHLENVSRERSVQMSIRMRRRLKREEQRWIERQLQLNGSVLVGNARSH